MILRLTSIDQFGVLDDFKWNRDNKLQDFKEKNIIYGWNYSGKTTLSRLFSSLKNKKLHEDFNSAKFKLKTTDSDEFDYTLIDSFPYNIAVFNQEYIQSKLNWNSKTELGHPIAFDVGENVETRKTIQDLEDSVAKIEKRAEPIKSVIALYDEYEKNHFTTVSKQIRLTVFDNTERFDKGSFKTVLKDLDEDQVENKILEDDDAEELKKISNSKNDFDIHDEIKYESNFHNLKVRTENLLKQEPPKDRIIEILDENKELRDWTERGLDFDENKEECAFCGNNVSEERIKLLQEYFSNASQTLRQEIEDLKLLINQEISNLDLIAIPNSKNDFTESVREEIAEKLKVFPGLKKNYKSCLKKLIAELNRKEDGNIFNALKIEDFQCDDANFSEWFIEMNKDISRHNNLVNNFDETRKDARNRLITHLVADFIHSEKFFEKEKSAQKAERRLNAHKKYIDKQNLLIQEKRDSLKTITKGKDQLNKFIQKFLNRKDIAIQVTSEDKFMLYRGDKPAINLSEGEKTAIAFSYFLVDYESMGLEMMCKTIIFIDDPISSLDTNHIAQVYSLINSFFFRKNIDQQNPDKVINCFLQFFISTHNFEFFSFLKDSANLKKRKKVRNEQGVTSQIPNCGFYQMQKLDSSKSILKTLPNELKNYKSEYIYLFKLIYEYRVKIDAGEDTYDILMPNAIRRFLEIYTLMKIPNEPDSVENRIEELVDDITQFKLLNHFSHFTSFEKTTRHDELLMVLPDATQELFDLLKLDEKHYSSLKKAIKAA
ncbi:AAA family ATPase [Salegentibacter salarius]|uniref:AAA family ATPase n=1 Tax=Salegentibacter salarius TaxID=435906 RepID=UPI0009A5656A|nr:AAA family ATPase [Salegentibacter salarius]SLJ86959.1 Wobble nucleotide-excising tRNase [Salegentibacter salarius]